MVSGQEGQHNWHWLLWCFWDNYNDVIMSTMASQITSLTSVYSTVYSDTDQRNHQSSASLAFVRGIHRWPVNSPHKGPVTRKMFPFDDVIMVSSVICLNFMLGSCYVTFYSLVNSPLKVKKVQCTMYLVKLRFTAMDKSEFFFLALSCSYYSLVI